MFVSIYSTAHAELEVEGCSGGAFVAIAANC